MPVLAVLRAEAGEFGIGLLGVAVGVAGVVGRHGELDVQDHGAVVGGVIVGVSQAFSTAYLPALGADLQIVVPLLLIVGVLIVKPEGLFGKTVAVRV